MNEITWIGGPPPGPGVWWVKIGGAVWLVTQRQLEKPDAFVSPGIYRGIIRLWGDNVQHAPVEWPGGEAP